MKRSEVWHWVLTVVLVVAVVVLARRPTAESCGAPALKEYLACVEDNHEQRLADSVQSQREANYRITVLERQLKDVSIRPARSGLLPDDTNFERVYSAGDYPKPFRPWSTLTGVVPAPIHVTCEYNGPPITFSTLPPHTSDEILRYNREKGLWEFAP